MSRLLRSRRLRDLFFLLGLGLCTWFLLRWPQEAVAAAKSGLQLCANVIVPSLFPFFILSSLVINLGLVRYLARMFEPVMRPVFGLSGACSAALALGMIGGYPVGARTAFQLYSSGQITKKEAERLLAFCNNCGPAFFFGIVGAGIFSSSRVGLLLFLIHMVSSLLIGIGYRLFCGSVSDSHSAPVRASAAATRFPAAFTASIKSALESALNICAFITCFTILIRFAFTSGIPGAAAGLISRLLPVEEAAAETILVGMIELTSGVWGLKEVSAAIPAKVAMAAFLLGWAGLCVHCQVLSFTGESDLSMRPYLTGKLLHGLISAALTRLVYLFVPLRESAAACCAQQVSALIETSFSAALKTSVLTAAILFCLILLICLRQMQKRTGISTGNRL